MNTTPYRNDGILKSSFYYGATANLLAARKRLLDYKKTYATLTKMDSTVDGLIAELDIMLKLVAQQELDQNEDAKLRKAKDKALLAEGFPKKTTAWEKLYKKHKAKRKD